MSRLDFVMSEADVDARALDGAIDRAASMLLQSLSAADGATGERHWDAPCDLGPSSTAQVLVALAHAGDISEEERREGSRWLRAKQHADGGFAAYPNAPDGHIGATASVLAALTLCALPENAEAISKAKQFIEQHGGHARVVHELQSGDVGALFLALAGGLDAHKLPNPMLAWTLIGPAVRWLETRMTAAVPFLALQLGVIVRRLRGDFGPNGDRRGPIESLECGKCIETLAEFQNVDGSWNANSMQTAMAIPALWAAGVPATDDKYRRALAWLRTQRRRDQDGIWFQSFGSGVWSTALNVAALLASGLSPSDPRIEAALRWIVASQCSRPQPVTNNRKPNAIRTGGWGFQRGNDLFADCDDTGVVLATLGEALAVSGTGALRKQTANELDASAKRGLAWVENMQNPDGGWAAFVWGLPSKPPGAAMQKPLSIDFQDPIAMIEMVLSPPLSLGDPSCEDLTGRVLCGLGAIGRNAHDPAVVRALQFFRSMQCEDGSFWGRWTMNYVASTAWVLLGAMAVDADPDDAWIKRAIQWLESKQNTDGGWGETAASYRDPRKAGLGPSNAPLTGIVVQALVAAARTETKEVKRAVNYLLRAQRPDGTWPSNGYLAPNIPPDTFYAYPETERHNPLRALARYRAELAHPSERPGEPDAARWNDTLLDTARTWMDPVADGVVEALLESKQIARADELFRALLHSADAIPKGLPPIAAKYFEDTEAMPAWADHAKIRKAQDLFERAGWQIAAALFCSSLPQAYAAANGATALSQTTGMRSEHIDQRIFETAQFLFDVVDRDSFDPKLGHAIRAAQKVRLMHAGVRRLILDRGGWDAATYGQPINMEDMAGTLMTFSVVTLDALHTLRISVTREEGEAWMHAWKVVGYFLGVRPEVVPVDVEDGRALMAAIRRRQWARSTAGRDLTVTLIGLMRTFGPAPLGDMPAALIRFLAGDYCGDLLGVPHPNWNRFVFEAGVVAGRIVDPFSGHSIAEEIFQKAAYETMRAVVEFKRGFKGASFRVPASLSKTVVSGH